MIVRADLRAVVTNVSGSMALIPALDVSTNFVPVIPVIPANSWPGSISAAHAQYSFKIPISTNFLSLTNSGS